MSTLFSGLPVRPFKAPAVNAGTSVTLDYSCRNLDNELEIPTVLRYRVDNLTDQFIVAQWTNVPTPGSTGSVTISAALNVMSYPTRDRQHNQVTFEATFADGDKVTSLAAYQLCAVYQAQQQG